MPSTVEERKKTLARVHRLQGQLNSLAQALENEEVACQAILQQIAAIRGATHGLLAQVLESHLRETLSEASSVDPHLQATMSDFINIIRTYLK